MINDLFWIKSNSAEWEGAGKIPVYCFGPGEAVDEGDIAQMAPEPGRSYAFIIFHERLRAEAARQIWEARQRHKILIPIHLSEIKHTLREQYSSKPAPAYGKLADLKRQWDALADPYASLNSFTDPQWFFGERRRAAIQNIVSDITAGGSHFNVFGMRRIGKTTLLHQLALACQERGYPVAKISCNPFSPEYTYAQALSEILQQWESNSEVLYPGFSRPRPAAEQYTLETAGQFKGDTFQLIEALQQQVNVSGRLVLILDNVDQIFPHEKSPEEVYSQYCSFAQFLKSTVEAPERVEAISLVAAMEIPWVNSIDRFPYNKQFQNPLHGLFQLEPVELLQKKDWMEMVQTLGALAGLKYSDESLDRLYRLGSSGHPEITRKLGSCLVQLRNRHQIGSSITPEEVRQAIDHFLDDQLQHNYLETTFWNNLSSTNLDIEQRLLQELAKEETLSEDKLLFRLMGGNEGPKIGIEDPAHNEESGQGNSWLARVDRYRLELKNRFIDWLLDNDEKIEPLIESSPSEAKNSEQKREILDALHHLVSSQIVLKDEQPGTYWISIPIFKDWIRRKILGMEVKYAATVQSSATPGNARPAVPSQPVQQSTPLKVIPIVGELSAGESKPVSDSIVGYIEQISEFEFHVQGEAEEQRLRGKPLEGSQLKFLEGYEYVAVKISGDSMDRVDICPDDYVILRKSNIRPDNRDIVAVVFRDEVDNKARLKRFLKEVDKTSSQIISVTLEPESNNSEYRPYRVERKELVAGNCPFDVVGIAVAVLKPETDSP